MPKLREVIGGTKTKMYYQGNVGDASLPLECWGNL
jgi:hypothetical protein